MSILTPEEQAETFAESELRIACLIWETAIADALLWLQKAVPQPGLAAWKLARAALSIERFLKHPQPAPYLVHIHVTRDQVTMTRQSIWRGIPVTPS